MNKPNGLDRISLRTQLRRYQFIYEANSGWKDGSLFANEGLVEMLELAQRYINVSQRWAELGEQTKSNDALRNTQIILMEVDGVVERVLYHIPFLVSSSL